MSSGGVNENSSKFPRKKLFFEKLNKYVLDYSRIMILQADNVGSNQMQQVRIGLRGRAELLMGKNTMMRKVLRTAAESNPALSALLPSIQGNVGLLFTNEDFVDIRGVIQDNRVPAGAKAGALAPADVFIPAGLTDMDPGQTNFLQILGIATKITRGKIEILSEVHVVKAGEKVGSSEAVLLQKLDIRPFTYGLEIVSLYDEGTVFSPEVLDLTADDIVGKFLVGVSNVAAISLEVGIPTLASVGHSVVNAYKNLLAVSVETEYTFEAAEKVKAYLADPSAFASAAPAAAAGAPAGGAPAAAAKKEESESEDDDMGFSLFD